MKALVWLPIISAAGQAVLTIISVATGLAMHLKSYEPFPYPSDLLEIQAERGLFALSLTIPAIATFAVISVRYLQVKEFNESSVRYLNVASFVVACVMLIGQNMVAAYSISDSVIVHFLGASFYFLCGAAFMIMQTYMSYKFREFHKAFVIKFRAILTLIACICPITYTIGRAALPKDENRYYIPHISEWVLATCLLLFIGTFASEFSAVRFKVDSYEEIDGLRHANNQYPDEDQAVV